MGKLQIRNIILAFSLAVGLSAQTLSPPPFVPSKALRAKIAALQAQEKATTDPVKRKQIESQMDIAMMNERQASHAASMAKYNAYMKAKLAKEKAAQHPGK